MNQPRVNFALWLFQVMSACFILTSLMTWGAGNMQALAWAAGVACVLGGVLLFGALEHDRRNKGNEKEAE